MPIFQAFLKRQHALRRLRFGGCDGARLLCTDLPNITAFAFTDRAHFYPPHSQSLFSVISHLRIGVVYPPPSLGLLERSSINKFSTLRCLELESQDTERLVSFLRRLDWTSLPELLEVGLLDDGRQDNINTVVSAFSPLEVFWRSNKLYRLTY